MPHPHRHPVTTPTTPTDPAPRPLSPAETIRAAVKQLSRCERGIQALADLRNLLRNGGTGLDRENVQALHILLTYGTRGGMAGLVLDELHPHRKRT